MSRPTPTTTFASLIFDRGQLERAFAAVSAVIERSATIPVLHCVLIEHDASGCRISGTNLDQTLIAQVDGVSGDHCAFAVNACFLAAVLRASRNQVQIVMTLTDDRLAVSSAAIAATIKTQPAADFPRPALTDPSEAEGAKAVLTVPTGQLCGRIAAVAHAISREETRYYLNGIYFEAEPELLAFTATDGHRLAHTTLAGEFPPLEPGILPHAAAMLLLRLLPAHSRPDTQITTPQSEPDRLRLDLRPVPQTIITRSEPLRIRFDFGPITLISKLIDGTYPEYRRITEKCFAAEIAGTLHTTGEALGRAVAAVRHVGYQLTPSASIVVSPDGCVLRCRFPEDDMHFEVPIVASYEGPQLTIGFNIRYLAQIAGAMPGDLVAHLEAAPQNPVRFTAPSRPGHWAVLMPMRLH